MRLATLLFALGLAITACGDSATTTTQPEASSTTTTTAAPQTTTTTTTPVVEGEGALRLTTVSFGANGLVAITNLGNGPVSTAGHWLCQRPAYFALPEVTLEPGQSLWVSVGEGATTVEPGGTVVEVVSAGNRVGSLAGGNGEMGLYSSNAFGSADAIVDYVEWGNRSGHGRSTTAVEGGVWLADDFVSTDDTTASIEFIGNPEGVGSGNWTSAIP